MDSLIKVSSALKDIVIILSIIYLGYYLYSKNEQVNISHSNTTNSELSIAASKMNDAVNDICSSFDNIISAGGDIGKSYAFYSKNCLNRDN